MEAEQEKHGEGIESVPVEDTGSKPSETKQRKASRILTGIFAIFMIYCYDCQVDRRQQMVMEKVETAGAIVSSIFPENVKRRLFQREGSGYNNDHNRRRRQKDYRQDVKRMQHLRKSMESKAALCYGAPLLQHWW